jgi:hypothetical protein
VIVRDLGDAWQVVLQVDHAELSGAIADVWADRGERHASVALAARRHDDGWAVWERSPLVDDDGRPVNFLDVQVPAHLAFYRAGIAAISDEDPYAGLLVSMHGTGIYRQRYGEDPGLKLTFADEVADLVEAFVAEQEGSHEERAAALGVDDDLRWADYRRLQAYDRLSLAFCMRDLAVPEPFELGPLRVEPRGSWSIGVDPFPLERAGVFRLRRRIVPKEHWSQESFREAFLELPVDELEVEISH